MDGSPSRDPVVVKKPFAVPRKKSEVRNDRGQDSSSAPEVSAAMALTMKSRITLNDGSKIPVLGLGVWQAASGKETRKADRKSTRLNSSHSQISYAVFCL